MNSLTLAGAMCLPRPVALDCVAQPPAPAAAPPAHIDLAIVMRSSGERTYQASAAAWQRQLAQAMNPVFELLCDRSGPAAFQRAIELGCKSGRAWVVVTDAAVLPSASALESLALACARARETTAAVIAPIWDKFDGRTTAGLVAFRAAFSQDLLAAAESARSSPSCRLPGAGASDAEIIGLVLEMLDGHGLGIEQTDSPLAIRGYEQAYLHTYLRMRRRALLSSYGDREPLWGLQRRYQAAFDFTGDRDFQAAAWGIEDGMLESTPGGRTPSRCGLTPWPGFDRRMLDLGIYEKRSLDAADISGLADRTLADRTDTRTLIAGKVNVPPFERPLDWPLNHPSNRRVA